MSQEITFTFPAIDETIIAAIEQETIKLNSAEIEAVQTIRKRFTPLTRHNGFIKTGWAYRGDGSNWREEFNAYMQDGEGRRIKGLLCIDKFYKKNYSQNNGSYTGYRLYLDEFARWIELTRSGNWSDYQGSPDGWSCGDVEWIGQFGQEGFDYGGRLKFLSDSEVAAAYDLNELLEQIASSLKAMAEKLPQRLTRIKAKAELAQQVISKLGSD